MTRQFFETSIIKAVYNKKLIESSLRFIAHHKNDVLLDADITQKLLATSGSTSTALQDIYQAALSSSYDFGIIHVPSAIKDIPEGMTYEPIPFDVGQMLDFVDNDPLRIICQSAGFEKKLLIPATGKYSPARQSLTDIESFQTAVLKVFLTRLFYDSKDRFLPATLINKLGTVYSILIGKIIGSMYDLSDNAVGQVQAVLLYYFYAMMMDERDVPRYYQVNAKQSLRYREVDIDFVIDLFKGKEVSYPYVFNKVIPHELGIQRLASFDAGILRQKTAQLLGDPITSTLFMTYPPYFIYGLLLAFSGKKIALTYRVMSMGLKPKERQDLTDELIRYIKHH